MSIFPTKILLATDGSTNAQLALRAAVDLTNATDSELHITTVSPRRLRLYLQDLRFRSLLQNLD